MGVNGPARCGCGHHKALHWHYGRMEGCRHAEGGPARCRCAGYRPGTQSLVDALTELLECVKECERDWCLMDRIDLSLGLARSRGSARYLIR